MKSIMRTIKGLVVVAIISALGFAAYAADSKKPTRIPVHNWSSQIVMAYVIGGILEDMGGNVLRPGFRISKLVWLFPIYK